MRNRRNLTQDVDIKIIHKEESKEQKIKDINELKESFKAKEIDLQERQERANRVIKKNFTLESNLIKSSKNLEIKDKMLAQQAKMASMGEMMDAVAHQWKQPLNSLSMMNEMLLDDFKCGDVDEEYLIDMTQTVDVQIAHMVNTLAEFRNFFRPSKDAKYFSLNECLESVKILMKDEILKHTITLDVASSDDISIYGFINEFKHLFLNLISNSIDAFNEKEIKSREIKIKTSIENEKTVIEFIDNALGIPDSVIESIFEPNVTTKADGKGTGIGLYMSSQIVKKHNGNITVENYSDGAKFKIVIG